MEFPLLMTQAFHPYTPMFYCSPLKNHCQVGEPFSGLSRDVWLWLVHSRTVPKTLVIETILLSCFSSVFEVKMSGLWFEFCLTFLPNIRNLIRSANRMLEIKGRKWRLVKCCSEKMTFWNFLSLLQRESFSWLLGLSPKPLLCRNDETLSRKLLSSLSTDIRRYTVLFLSSGGSYFFHLYLVYSV